MIKKVLITKMNGKKEFYSENKLRNSLGNSGADKETIDAIILKVNNFIYEGMGTKELFKFAFKELKKRETTYASKYNIKGALMDLRLSGGYVFEKFVSRILNYEGYETILNRVVKGENITHEIDVLAKKDGDVIMVECKHHNKPWLGCHIQTALYVYARFLDVKKTFTIPMLVTNTKFSNQIIKYSDGVGLKLIGWKYPRENSLEIRIEKSKLYPITILNISRSVVEKCLKNDILTIEDLKNNEPLAIVEKLGVDDKTAERLIKESRVLQGKNKDENKQRR